MITVKRILEDDALADAPVLVGELYEVADGVTASLRVPTPAMEDRYLSLLEIHKADHLVDARMASLILKLEGGDDWPEPGDMYLAVCQVAQARFFTLVTALNERVGELLPKWLPLPEVTPEKPGGQGSTEAEITHLSTSLTSSPGSIPTEPNKTASIAG